MQFIQGVKRVKTLFFRPGALLPVNPPEIDTLLFERMMEDFKICTREFLRGNIERYRFIRSRINADRLRHIRVLRFVRVHTLRGVKV